MPWRYVQKPSWISSDHDPIGSDHDLVSLFAHDLFGKPVPTFPDHALAEPAGDIVLRTSIARRGEDLVGFVELDQLTKIHEGGLVGDARGLLHVMGNDRDGVVLRQFLDQ